ncbi:MAG: DNRLRE domain-containing protein [Planctomycetota bacterium]|jgi:hypothetical protein
MCKKLLFLMAFLVLMAAGTQAYAGIIFQSNWENGLGTSVNAITDGGVWEGLIPYQNNPHNGNYMLEVFPPDHPVLNGHNYLGIWMDGEMNSAVWTDDIWPANISDLYYRFYMRVYPHNVAPSYLDFGNGHFIQGYQWYPPDNMFSYNGWMGIQSATSTDWNPYFSSFAHPEVWAYPYNNTRSFSLDPSKWYRVEGHVHYFRGTEVLREKGDGSTRVATYVYVNIYDANGTLVKETEDWSLGDPSTQSPVYTLPEWYGMGRYYWMEGTTNSWYVGNNGPATATGLGWAMDFAALEVRDDTWPGPVDSGPTTPGQAYNPNPPNNATDISADADLSWTAGANATSHDVYFGTDSTPDSGEDQGNQTATTYEPGTMTDDTTYYWRIDEINANGTTTGTVWTFTTEDPGSLPGTASNPSPANSAVSVSISADLSWTEGAGSTSSNVYFGTDPTPDSGELQGNQTATTYDPGTLTNDTTYYWRIDEINATGTTTGSLWSFTTVAAPTGEVGIIGSWVSGTTHAEQAGSNRALIFIAHAESSADTSDLGSVTYGGQSMTKVVERNMHYSYSAYTCAFILDEAGIDAATSGTFSPSWNTSPSGTPAYTSVFLENVNQATLFGDNSTGGSTTTTAQTSALSNNNGDMVILAATCGNDAAYTTINSFIEAIEVAPSSADGIGGYIECTGTDVTPGVSHTNVNRQSIIGFVVKAGENGPTPPEKPTSPSPTNLAADVAITANLSWTAGSGATSHDVYFGIDSTPNGDEFQGNQTATTFEPGTLTNDVTYYWRIDQVNSDGTTEGTVWSFTTIVAAPGQATNPSPADSATDVNSTADLSWTAGSDATSHNVYFGTTSPGTSQGNQTATSFDTGTMDANTTYYWRIDEINTAGTTTGNVWSFTTAAATAGEVEIIGSWTSGTTHTEESGSNRALIFIACADTYVVEAEFGSVTYGGQSMTMIVERDFETSGPEAHVYTCAFILDEDGIDAATSSTFSPTWDVAPWETPAYISVFLENVNQTTLVGATATGGSTTATAETSDLSNNDGDMAIVAAASRNPGAYTTINSFTEAIEVYIPTGDGIAGYRECTGTDVTPGVSHNNHLSQAVIGFVVKAAEAASAPGKANGPNPANSAADVIGDPNLSWTAGANATSHDVYFGTDSTPDAGESKGNQTATTYDPGSLSNSTTYYWRIDEVNATATTTGDIWSFTTAVAPPGAASSPTPANSAANVAVDADLSWTAGSGATTHHVYFGPFSPGAFQLSQTTTTFNPGIMENDTTYYWRIDEVNAGGTTTGTVWSFTTIVAAPSQATDPGPTNGATDVGISADLSWTAGSGSTSSDVYFGTSSPGTSQGNQTATSFDTGTMDANTTYYWRIDEINLGGTTTGAVWSFTTEAGGPATEEFGDAANTDYPGTIEDTWCNQGGGGTTNYSTATQLNTYTWPADTSANTTIIKWDLTDISTSATVTQATLYLYQIGSGGDSSYDISVHKITGVNPVINACSWNTYDGTNSWTGGADGGLSDIAAAEDTPSVNNTDDQYKTWDVTDMVADWVATPANNYGMLLNSDDVASSDSYRYFASSDAASASTRPKLIVSYSTGTPPGQASNPSPADSAADVSVDVDLSWTAGSDSTSSNVYFGNDSTPDSGELQGNQTATTFDPGTLAIGTTYYWRIDEINASGTTTGTVWSFTTLAGDVEILGSWVSGTTHAEESGTNRALIFIAHADSYVAEPDLASVTYGGQSMTMVVERDYETSGPEAHVYTCAFILDEDGIDAATSSTFSPTWNQTPGETPAYTSVFLENVNQTTLVGATATGGSTTATAQTSALSNNDGDMAIVAAACRNPGGYTTINNFTEAIEVFIPTGDGIAGYRECTGDDVTPGVSHDNHLSQAVIGFIVQAE